MHPAGRSIPAAVQSGGQPDAYLSTGEIVNPESLPPDQRYALEILELYSGTIVPALGVTVEF